MEVASPLPFVPGGAGKKRSHACSPQLMDTPGRENLELNDGIVQQRTAKRRRFHETSIDSLSEDFSSHSLFFSNGLPQNQSIFSGLGAQPLAQSFKRMRSETSSPAQDDVNNVVKEQAAMIESLKKDKTGLETELASLKSDHERVVKENQILRKAVTIQQERQTQAENEAKAAKEQTAQADERIRGLEQVILNLRYHMQAQQPTIGNDFLHQPPPDVF